MGDQFDCQKYRQQSVETGYESTAGSGRPADDTTIRPNKTVSSLRNRYEQSLPQVHTIAGKKYVCRHVGCEWKFVVDDFDIWK